MNQSLRTLVLLFLQTLPESKHEQFNQAYEFYKKSEGKNLSTERNLNRIGFTETGLENLLYDLQKMHDITDIEIASAPIASAKQVEDIEVNEDESEKGIDLTSQSAPKDSPIDGLKNFELTQKVAEFTEPKDGFYKTVSSEELNPIREDYPFLNDPNCPQLLFVVVGKKISLYRTWQAAQQKLAAIDSKEIEATPEEVSELATIAESSFRENQQLHDELNYFAEHGEILGKHSLFRETVAQREVEEMTVAELSKFRNSSSKFFTDQKKALLKHAANVEKTAEINQKIADRKYKLSLVNAKVGITDDGK